MNVHSPFSQKVALVTGGTSGIGRATAVAFAAQGAKVVVSGRREPEGIETVSLIQKAGGEGVFVRADVSKEEDHINLVARTVEHFGRLDFAFNNAGIIFDRQPITQTSKESFDQTMAVNVGGVFLAMKHQIPAMLRSGGGAIVNNASVLGLRPTANRSSYNASKYAVIGLTKTVALEFAAQGVRINAVCPAIIATDLTAELLNDEKTHAYLRSLHPVGRVGDVEEVAGAVIFLCSPAASFMTGVALPVDGGFAI